MFDWLRHWIRHSSVKTTGRRRSLRARLDLETLEERALMATGVFVQTNLVSDIPGMAQTFDPNLLNPWGLTAGGSSPFWVSDNNSGDSTLYSGQGAIVPLVVTIPSNTPGVVGAPSGTVANTANTSSQKFFNVAPGKPSAFLFDTEDGQIDAWGGGTVATVEYTNNSAGYKGLTLGTDANGDNLLYAANFAQNSIDVFDSNFALVQGAAGATNASMSPIKLKGDFTDPNLPAGYWPFNIQNVGGNLYVEYAQFDPTTTEGLPGAGKGFVDVYNGDGVLQTRLISGGALNAPWGVAMAPSNFGAFSGDLLVGNFGNGWINAYKPDGTLVGPLTLPGGQVFHEDDLWALRFGNGATSKTGVVTAPTNTLYFTAGINGQKDGLFGSVQAPTSVTIHAPILPNLPGTAVQTFPTNTNTNPTTAPNVFDGDNNPYGVAFVPQGFEGNGVLQPGDLLVSNFNSNSGTQGTGTTIVRITPDGERSVFFTSTQIGLDTALGVLKSGFVIVGNLPNSNGTIGQGSLQILDANGKVVATLTDSKLLDGPWDLTINDEGDHAQVFVSNVLSGTVTRIDLAIPDGKIPKVESMTQIASGFGFRTDPNALVVGPTGLAYNPRTETLYVASTADNAIFAIPDAGDTHHDHGTGTAIVQNDPHLHGPLGLVLAPNGDLIVANGDAVNPGGTPNDLVEFDRFGDFVGSLQIDSGGPGAAFGIALSTDNGVNRFAAVDDNPDATIGNSNTVSVWTLGVKHEEHDDHDHDHGHDHEHGHDHDHDS